MGGWLDRGIRRVKGGMEMAYRYLGLVVGAGGDILNLSHNQHAVYYLA